MSSMDIPHFAMNAGDGPLSYVKNSSYQGGVLEAAKAIIEEEIVTKLEISSTQNPFRIADFGCSTGNNSFLAMHIIIEAIKRKHESSNLKTPEFYAFFNDVVTNDFKTLFGSLPPQRDYSAAAVPGDFHCRLLPPSSLHFAYSSWSLHWLTEAPQTVANAGGEILYGRERNHEVYDAYLDEFERDMESFLKCRAVEIVDGGLMALLIPAQPTSWDPQNDFTVASMVELLRSSLLDMAKKGRLRKTKLDSFNFPYYFPTPQELKAIFKRSDSFTIERMETLKIRALPTVDGYVACFRAVHQTMFTHHFGVGIIDELFDLFKNKLATSPVFTKTDNDRTVMLLAILKRRIV